MSQENREEKEDRSWTLRGTCQETLEKGEELFWRLERDNLLPKTLLKKIIGLRGIGEDPFLAARELEKKPPFYFREPGKTVVYWIMMLTFMVCGAWIPVKLATNNGYGYRPSVSVTAGIIWAVAISVLASTLLIKFFLAIHDDKEKRQGYQVVIYTLVGLLQAVAERLDLTIEDLSLCTVNHMRQASEKRLRNLAQKALIDQKELNILPRTDPVVIKLAAEKAIASKRELLVAHEFFAGLDLADKEWDNYWPKTEKPARRGSSLPGSDSVVMKSPFPNHRDNEG